MKPHASLPEWFSNHQTLWESWLHTIHRQPEIGFEENHTANFVAQQLLDLGIEFTTGVGGTGVVGILRGTQGEGRIIAFRAELDALPMQECSGVHYHSTIDGKFHGCGHDGHTVTLLAAAHFLAKHRAFSGTAMFVFQPAEELLRGAQAMLADGLLARFPCDEMYALHNLPGLGFGQVGVPELGALASADQVQVEFFAKGTHGSAPHTGQDAVLASAYFLTTLQASLTRLLDSRASGVISFGSIHGGQAYNILPDHLQIDGTIRTHDESVRNLIKQQLHQVASSTELVFGVKATVRFLGQTPVTQNHQCARNAVLAVAQRIAGEANVHSKVQPLMASEDFAYFLQQVPGAYFFMGQDGPYCHHPEFIFDTRIIPLGAAIIAELIIQQTAKTPSS